MLLSKRLICSRSIVWFLLAVGIVSAGKVCADQTFDQTNPNKVWDTTTKNWDAGANTWLNDGSSNAIFTGTAQTLDVNGTINVHNITFNSSGWNIGDPTGNGTLNFGGPSTITVASGAVETISDVIASGSLTVSSPQPAPPATPIPAGTLVLSGANTFSGNVIVSSGILKVTNNQALGDTTGTTSVATDAALVLGNNVTITGETIGISGNALNFAGALQADAGAHATFAGILNIDTTGARVGAGDGGVLTISGVIQGATNNALVIGNAPSAAVPGVVVISGTLNTYTGSTQVLRGVLKIGASNALPTGTTLDVDSSTAAEDSIFDLNGFNQTVAALTRSGSGSGTGGSFITNNGAMPSTLTVNQTGTFTYSGVIKDGASTVALTKSGPGLLTLSGTNTYTGATQITGGTLGLSGSLTGTPITVTAGALSETSTGRIGGSFGVTISSGTSTLAGTNTYSGSTTVNGAGATLNLSGSLTGTPITVTAGALSETSAGAIGGASSVTLNGGTATLAGTNTYSGATLVNGTGVTLTLSGSVTDTPITVTLGALNESSTGVIGGASTVTITAGTSTLGGANTYTGLTSVGATGILKVTNNLGLGSAAGATVISGSGGYVVLSNGVTVTGETITIFGAAANSDGPLQSDTGATAEWAGNVILNGSSRIGGGVGGTLTVSGVISGGNASVLFSRADNSTTILNAVSTYTGDTQLFANNATGVGDTLKIGVDNAINSASQLSIFGGATSTHAMTFDLNGHVLALRSLDTTGQTVAANAANLHVTDNAAGTSSTLTLADPLAADTATFGGILTDGGGGTGILSLVKGVAGVATGSKQILIAANTYSGSTTVNGGILQIGSASGAAGALASTSFILNGGTFSVNNAGVANNNTNRISDLANFSFNGGTFLFTGSDQAASDSTELINSFALNSGLSTLTVTATPSANNDKAIVTLNTLTRPANGGIALVNGAGLGSNSTSLDRLMINTAPTSLVGTTADQGNGINATAQNTKIVPYLLGEVTAATGGAGTASGTANTFVTWSASGGLRPLNLTDEFTQNAFTAGNNIRLTATTADNTSVSINSLILEKASASIASNQTLTVASGAVFFSSGDSLGLSGGTLAFGGNEGIITINSTGTTTIGSLITGTAGVSYYGAGTLVVDPAQSTYSGNTLLKVGFVVPRGSSTGPAGAPVSGPFGTGTLILGGSQLRASNSGTGVTLANAVSFAADTTIFTTGMVDQSLTFTGPVTLTGNRTLTQLANASTIFSGIVDDGGNHLGLTIAGPATTTATSAPVVLSGANTYTGATTIKGGSLVVSGSLSGSSPVLVGDSANSTTSAILGGGGTVGNVTVGASLGNTGATLMPHLGSTSTATGTTFHAGTVTFANSSAHLSLLLGRTSAFSGSAGDGGAGGDVSDHLSTGGPLTLNGADLQLSLLTTAYTPVNGDVFFLTINGGVPINGTFSSLNGVATDLSEGATLSTFALGSQAYQITYLANYATNSFTGGHDIALLAVVPEPGTLVSLFGGLGCLLGAQRFRRTRRSRGRSGE